MDSARTGRVTSSLFSTIRTIVTSALVCSKASLDRWTLPSFLVYRSRDGLRSLTGRRGETANDGASAEAAQDGHRGQQVCRYDTLPISLVLQEQPAKQQTGKSSLTVQFVDGHFVDSYYPTVENTFSKVIRYKNHDFAVEIIDTAGQDEYTILNSKHFIGIHGYMIVYSVASKQSFEMCRIIRDKILNHTVCAISPAV